MDKCEDVLDIFPQIGETSMWRLGSLLLLHEHQLTIQDGEPSLMRRLVWSWTLHVARCRTRGVWARMCTTTWEERRAMGLPFHHCKSEEKFLMTIKERKKRKKGKRKTNVGQSDVNLSMLVLPCSRQNKRACETNSESGGIHGIFQMNSMFPDPWILGEVEWTSCGGLLSRPTEGMMLLLFTSLKIMSIELHHL